MKAKDFISGAIIGGIIGVTVWSFGISVPLAFSFGVASYLGFIVGRSS